MLYFLPKSSEIGKLLRNNFNFNRGNKHWGKVKKSSKNGKDKKPLISAPPESAAAVAKVLFLGGRLGNRVCHQPTLGFP